MEDLTDEQLRMIIDMTDLRVMKISKDDLRLSEQQLLWSPDLKIEILKYWSDLNTYWAHYKESGELPPCTCLDHEGGFLGKRSAKGKIYNDFFYEDEPCSLAWYELNKVKEQ